MIRFEFLDAVSIQLELHLLNLDPMTRQLETGHVADARIATCEDGARSLSLESKMPGDEFLKLRLTRDDSHSTCDEISTPRSQSQEADHRLKDQKRSAYH